MQTTPGHFPRKTPSARIAACLAAAMLAATMSSAPAQAGVPFASKHFTYRADGKKLAEVLQDFAASQGLPIVVDPGLEGTVNANFNTSPEGFLAAMTRSYGVIWYFDGTTLFIYPSRAMQSRVFRMRGYDRQQVRQMLGSLGLGDARFPLRFDDANQTLLAYGPPRHIELVATVLGELERDGHDRVGKSILVVPLRFATAGDRTFGDTKVPGLANTLNSLFSSGESNGQGASQTPKAMQNAIVGRADKQKAAQATYGLQLPESGGVNAAAKRDEAQRSNQLGSSDPLAPTDAERPWFQSEESTNAIIVRGLPDRMREYESLIHQLDIPQDLVEIEASIIDIRSDDFESLGVDWNFSQNGTTRLSISPGTTSTTDGGSSELLAGTNITTLIGNAGRQLLAHVKALEGLGKAHVLARPKVLGAVNRTATMTDKRVASVRVAGNLDASLFTIETGTTLKVTPQIVTYPDHREVRLSLSIQDGDFEGAVVDQVPIVKQTEINTEASVREGESLLIGGISIESDSNGTSGVPLLSKIPFLGAAFRHDETAKSRTERLFLLTPKVISVGGIRPTANAASRPSAAPAAAPVGMPPAVAVPAPPPHPPVTPSAPVLALATPRPPVASRAATALASAARAKPADTSCAVVALGLAADCASAGNH
jgi:type III secretion protein C